MSNRIGSGLRRLLPPMALLFVVLASVSCARTYTNPIMAGDWSDPGLIRVGDDFYTCRSSFGWQPGIPIAHSKDLLHWRYIGYAFESFPRLAAGDTRNGIWGLEMGYNPNTKQFLIYAPTRDREIFVFHADRPEGPYQSRSLGAGLGIDPGFFADDDGRLYLLANRGIIHELERDGLSIKGEVARIDVSYYRYFEGPDIFRRGDYYYLLFSDGGTLPHQPSTISTLRAKSLKGPWEEDPANPVMFSTDSEARFEGPAHGSLIETPRGEWFIAYHAHELAYYSLGREMLLSPVEWTADGWWRPAGGRRIPDVTAAAPRLPRGDFQLAQSDEFGAPKLGLQWFFLCAPDFSGKTWSLTERPGWLRLRSQPGDLGSLEALPGVFQQRVIDRRFAFETKLTFDAAAGGEAAGLQMYHDPKNNFWLALSARDGQKRIEIGKTSAGQRSDLWSVAYTGGATVWLKIAVDGAERATFFYGADGKSWTPIGESIYFGASDADLRDGLKGDPDLGWVGVAKGNTWTGTTFGVFAVKNGAPAARDADFEWFRVEKPEGR